MGSKRPTGRFRTKHSVSTGRTRAKTWGTAADFVENGAWCRPEALPTIEKGNAWLNRRMEGKDESRSRSGSEPVPSSPKMGNEDGDLGIPELDLVKESTLGTVTTVSSSETLALSMSNKTSASSQATAVTGFSLEEVPEEPEDLRESSTTLARESTTADLAGDKPRESSEKFKEWVEWDHQQLERRRKALIGRTVMGKLSPKRNTRYFVKWNIESTDTVFINASKVEAVLGQDPCPGTIVTCVIKGLGPGHVQWNKQHPFSDTLALVPMDENHPHWRQRQREQKRREEIKRRRSESGQVFRSRANTDHSVGHGRSSAGSKTSFYNRSRAGSKGNRIPMVRRRTESRPDAEQEQPSVGRKKGISMVSRRRSNTAPPAEGDSGAIRNSIPSEELASEYRYSENTLTEKMAHFFEDLPTSYRSRSRAKTSPTANSPKHGSSPEDAGRWNRHKPHSYRNRLYSGPASEPPKRSNSPNPFLDLARSG